VGAGADTGPRPVAPGAAAPRSRAGPGEYIRQGSNLRAVASRLVNAHGEEPPGPHRRLEGRML